MAARQDTECLRVDTANKCREAMANHRVARRDTECSRCLEDMASSHREATEAVRAVDTVAACPRQDTDSPRVAATVEAREAAMASNRRAAMVAAGAQQGAVGKHYLVSHFVSRLPDPSAARSLTHGSYALGQS